MNYDGKAFVTNKTVRLFTSEHGYAFVRNSQSNSINNLCLTKGRDIVLVIPERLSNSEILNVTDKIYSSGLVPYTIQVYDNSKEKSLAPLSFINIRDASIHKIQDDFSYKPEKKYVSRLQPTNIKYNPKSAIVYNSEQKESVVSFAGVSVNVNSKVEVVIPEKVTDYSDLSIVVQKNCFIEIKVPESATNVTNLPDALMYLPGYIKGTFTQSGEYNIKVKYPDGEQIINIVVPYYQRLL